MKIEELLKYTIQRSASDLHLVVDYPPLIRVDGILVQAANFTIEDEYMKQVVDEILSDPQKEFLDVNKEIDLSYEYVDTHDRFRINVFHQKGHLSIAFRLIPSKIRTIEELFIPDVIHSFTKIPQGLVLVTGPTGHGKSTTLAAMVQEINVRDPKHIITVEDPIEYVYPKGKSLIEQREVGEDTHSWDISLRSALREDPDVVLIGEMRDFETIASAITIAETGHLVFATLHTNSAAQTIDRIVDVFPDVQQAQIRIQLADILEGIVSQRLIPTIGGGRRVVTEILIATSAVRNMVREGKTYQLDSVIQTSGDVGMVSLDKSLVALVREGKITIDDAQAHSSHPDELLRLFRGRNV
ncbi:MAG: type IV pilus twitching motility protein PilT [Patescibacteria group bacterium]|jgi:twitching motility protein PilT